MTYKVDKAEMSFGWKNGLLLKEVETEAWAKRGSSDGLLTPRNPPKIRGGDTRDAERGALVRWSAPTAHRIAAILKGTRPLYDVFFIQND